ncbi:MAG TPA: AraC family transcriptional regulator [Ideonella sp.]|nr:AraC family transcriptional regulator [Ideonella sp.]
MDNPLTNRSALPLAHHRVFQSSDVDEAREFVARIFCPHELSPLGRGGRLDACHHSALVHRHASINYVQYGAAVRIEPGYLREFFLLQIPLRGGASVRCGGQSVESHPLLASVPSPTDPLSMVWAEDSPQLIVKFDRRALWQRLESLLQAPLRQALVFDLAVDLSGAAAGGLAALVGYLRSTLEHGQGFSGHETLAEQAENHLLSSLLLSLPHNYSAALAGASGRVASGSGGVLPRTVKRAQEILRAHVELPISLDELCTLTGASARSLQQGFARHTGCSPMAWLRELRLDHARAQLQRAAGPGAGDGCQVRVATVAANCGFFHLGHFAAHYRRRFGESPSQTAAGAIANPGPTRLFLQEPVRMQSLPSAALPEVAVPARASHRGDRQAA